MSTTDNRELAYQYAIDSVCGDNFGSDVWNEFAHGIRTTIYARVSEYDASQSTPAGEVTADAVDKIAQDATNEIWSVILHRHVGEDAPYKTTGDKKRGVKNEILAALAAAFPVLVQQVERVRSLLNVYGVSDERMRGHISTGIDVLVTRFDKQVQGLQIDRDALSAANARLAKDAERLGRSHSAGQASGG